MEEWQREGLEEWKSGCKLNNWGSEGMNERSSVEELWNGEVPE